MTSQRTASVEPVESPPAPVVVIERSTTAMKTVFTISVTNAIERESGKRAVEEAFDEIRRVEALMSAYDPNSALSHVNANAGQTPVTVPFELIELLEESKKIGELSGGKFNILAQTLMGLWNHRNNPPRLPDPAEVSRRVRLLEPKNITIDRVNGTVGLTKPGIQIGLGGIAKGYAVDRAGQVLRRHQIADFIVDGGGNLYVAGKKGTKPWNVGIQDPRARDRHFTRLDLPSERGVSTSGDYVKFFMIDGKRYHHILDPSTGYPARGVVSATVIAPTATLADGLSTAVFVLGVEKGLNLIEADPTLDAIIVDDQLRVHVSSRLTPYVKLSPIVEVAPKLTD